MTPGATTAWRVVSLSPLPAWALVGLSGLVVLGVALAVLGLRREPSALRRRLLLGLRLLAGAMALFFLLEPGFRQLARVRVKNRVAVLVDRSASMGFPSRPDGPTRAAVAAEALERFAPGLEALKDRYLVELYGFDPALSPLSVEQLRASAGTGTRTDLMPALRALKASDTGGSRKLAGAILLSDGADNGELQSGLTPRLSDELGGLGFPVSTVRVGEPALLDLAVENVKVDDFAFVRNAISVELELHARGMKGKDVPVVLQREGVTLGTRTVHIDADDDRKPLSFTFTPDQTGRFVYTVGAPVYPGEAVTENNSRSFVLKVIRDRVRVLLVVGRPSWDERFLRGLLKQDANVDLVSFYILRTSADDTQTRNPERELSLIPFPMEEIFDTKLHTFDVVVFQNFGYAEPALSIASYERNLEQYVQGGGALLVIGGDHAFGEGRAAYPVLDRALPVDPSGIPALTEQFKLKLTPDGLRHPVTRVQTSESQTLGSWDELPPASGLNLVRLKPGATVLLEHPTAHVDGRAAPVLALWDHGRGRAMALMTDDSWTWSFTARRSGGPSRHYDRFWGNALRWLVRDPDLTFLQVTADPPSVEPGRPIGAVVTVRQPDYQAAAGAEVRVDLFSIAQRKVLQQRTATAGQDGIARVSFDPAPGGAYKLQAQARVAGKDLGEAEDAVAVRSVGPELADASVRTEMLAELAHATGGRAYELPLGSLPDVPLLDPPLVEVGRSKDAPLWDRWGWLIALAVLLGGEWLLRRRFGYI
jgi:uncharacterized membrane protein